LVGKHHQPHRHASEHVHLDLSHNEVAEKTNLLASYVGTKAVDESVSANLVLIDFSSSSTFSSFAALN
jgi:hypothetical protein